jgi:hypothetical protein
VRNRVKEGRRDSVGMVDMILGFRCSMFVLALGTADAVSAKLLPGGYDKKTMMRESRQE